MARKRNLGLAVRANRRELPIDDLRIVLALRPSDLHVHAS